MSKVEIRVPDIGDFKDVPVIEVMVAPGAVIEAEAPIIALESDKATMEVPTTVAGRVSAVHVKTGDKVSEGSLILTLETAADAPPISAKSPDDVSTPRQSPPAATAPAATRGTKADLHAEVLVLGAGPGGYTAAFRAADLGKSVVLVERWPTLGGVCLNVGCIPSKALLHAAKVLDETADMAAHGITFTSPVVDLARLRSWKDGVVKQLTDGLSSLARQRKVTVVAGTGVFSSSNEVAVTGSSGTRRVSFDSAIVAVGSEPVTLPFIPHGDRRVIDSTGALDLKDIPKRLLVIGGGIIGLEMATVYHALGSRVTVVELMSQIIPGADKDIVMPLMKRIEKRYDRILLKTKVTKVEAGETGLEVHFDGPGGPATDTFDKVLVAVGRRPLGDRIGADKAGVAVDGKGFIPVDRQMRTNCSHIFGIGDVVGQPMLAHKATHEGKVAAEVACGMKSAFDARVIPSVAYTDPEVAWVGLTEADAKAQGVKVGKGVFPWSASGRSLSLGRSDGVTKLIFDPESHRLLGCAMVGPNAGELVAEAALAIELGADAADIGQTIHPHPTLSETVAMASEVFEGTITDLLVRSGTRKAHGS